MWLRIDSKGSVCDGDDVVEVCGGCDNNHEKIVATGIDVVEDIAVDWLGGNLYWTDYGMETIEVVSLIQQHRMVLFSENITNPRAIEVDPRDG
ncbi:hypothetical protein RRG08_034923 [Elysia crispata]|uniref:Uncharacterized protein n=1 Tax=Elysia crispata TaxID=231223 RepID=A0AAE1CR42_9GAST|nr:hypothetical protein RRG08_034923 [Elysia crispata]